MVHQTASIRSLPPNVAAQIKSSASIPSLSHAVLGLVENSLDAGAGSIELSVDFRRGSCSVEDDGHGISPAEFGEFGGLGKPYREIEVMINGFASGWYTQIPPSITKRPGSMEPTGHFCLPWQLYLFSRSHLNTTHTMPTVPWFSITLGQRQGLFQRHRNTTLVAVIMVLELLYMIYLGTCQFGSSSVFSMTKIGG